MRNKWTRAYRTISSVGIDGDKLVVKFANGNAPTVECSTLVPPGVKHIKWHDASVAFDGSRIVVPSEPSHSEIPWDVIRNLTDETFARQMAKRAAEQARYIGARLRELRQRRGLTQSKVASIAGIEPSNLSRIENGRFDLSTSTLWRVLAAMGHSPRDLAPQGEAHARGASPGYV